MTAKRSPLRETPLRNPGQSLDERRSELLLDKLLFPVLIAWFLVSLAGIETYRGLTDAKPQPLLFWVIALCGVAFALVRVLTWLPLLKNLRLARDGERVVGQGLDELRSRGYQVFHDVVGNSFNIDHVVIGPGGIYTIETKTRSKAVGRDPKVWFNGQELRVDGYESDRDPVVQARAQARWIRELLCESTGKQFPVRPVILFPGWFVEQTPGSLREIWVLNPKALPEFLRNESPLLPPEDIKLASFHLTRFIRSVGT